MTRSSHRWQSRPGSFDVLNGAHLFPSDNDLGIPTLHHTSLTQVPCWLAPYCTRIRSQREPADGAVHFFLDDYRFETVWSRPRKALATLAPYQTLLTPDFSLYQDWPASLQIWNTYRSRWCGAYWQAQGFTVIPTVSWSTAESYSFCFLGLPQRSVVALSTVGVNLGHSLEYQLFIDGFQEMVRRLQPSRVLCYGSAPAACHELVEVTTYPTRWQGIRAARCERVRR
ncbi:MAG: DUF4417 domain-containing protein [Chloroflexota bacterium]